MKNKKGFTLIELLAVIVILSVIMVIAIPKILNVIENSRMQAAKISAKGYIDAINYQNGLSQIDNTSKILDNDVLEINKKIKIKGDKPTEGSVEYSLYGKVASAEFCISNYFIKYEKGQTTVLRKCTEDSSVTEPDSDLNYVEKDSTIFKFAADSEKNTSNLLKDLGTKNNDGTINGAAFRNDALVFDGEDDYVSIGEVNYPNITYEVNFKVDSFKENPGYIIANIEDGGCTLYTINKQIVGSCHINNEYKYLTSNIEANKNYTAALTYDGKDLKLYLNGEVVSEETYNAELDFPENNTILLIGANPIGSKPEDYQYFKGNIYSSRVYSEALTIDDLKSNYLIDNNKYDKKDIELSRSKTIEYDTTSNLNTETVLKDLSGNNNDGVINNALLTSDGLIFDGNYVKDHVKSVTTNYKTVTYNVVFKPLDLNNAQTVMSNFQNGGIGFEIYSPGNLEGSIYISGDYQTISTQIEKSKVYVATITYDGYDFKMYLNNKLIDTKVVGTKFSYPDSNTIMMLGMDPSSAEAYANQFDGSIYYASVYDRALNVDEISTLHTELMNKFSKKTSITKNHNLIINYDMTSEKNTDTNLIDLSSNNINSTLYNTTYTDDGLYFNGSNSYASIGQMNLNNFTYIIKFKADNVSNGYQSLFANYENSGIGIVLENAKVQVWAHDGGSYRVISTPVESNKEYEVAVTFDKTVLKLYLDGEEKASYNMSYISPAISSTIMMIGANPNGSTATDEFFKGTIKYLKVYNRALTKDEIVQYR